METMAELIEQVRARYEIDSDYRLAQLLGVTRSAIHHIKIGRTKHLSEKTAYQIAALLGLNPTYVLLCLAVERSKTDQIKRVWEQLSKGVSKSAAAILLAATMMPSLPAANDPGMYIMSNYRRRNNHTTGGKSISLLRCA